MDALSGTSKTTKLTDAVSLEENNEVLDNPSKITSGLWNMGVYANEKKAERTRRTYGGSQ